MSTHDCPNCDCEGTWVATFEIVVTVTAKSEDEARAVANENIGEGLYDDITMTDLWENDYR